MNELDRGEKLINEKLEIVDELSHFIDQSVNE